jgi:hypothetical protein
MDKTMQQLINSRLAGSSDFDNPKIAQIVRDKAAKLNGLWKQIMLTSQNYKKKLTLSACKSRRMVSKFLPSRSFDISQQTSLSIQCIYDE